MQSFKAFRIHKNDDGIRSGFETISLNDLAPGNVTVKVTHSTINYKDALAATGTSPILRRYPLVGGIDLAGVVVDSADDRYREGDTVLVNGCGLSETHDGGYAEYARLDGDWLVPVPGHLDAAAAMTIGTAGFTAALAIHRMEQNGQRPDGGPVMVTGATGGVGSLAIDMLAGRGYEVHALTGKADSEPYLAALGATTVVLRDGLDLGWRPLEKARFAGAIDNLGGDYLTWLTRTTGYGGNIASVGLAASPALTTTVMPFILRAVNLLGINSVETPRDLRLAVWARIGDDLAPRRLDVIGTRDEPFERLPALFQGYLDGTVTGRTVIRVA